MKNKNIIMIVGILLSFIVFSILFLLSYNKVNTDIYDINWYRYDQNTGYYDIFKINRNEFSYYSSNEQILKKYNNCTSYNYDKRNSTLKLNCNKDIKIVKIYETMIILNINNKDYYYFKNIDDSINYEFKKYYNMSITEYNNKNKLVKELIKIDYSKIDSIYNSSSNSYLIISGNNCSNIECSIISDVLEKWVIKNENIYYFDSSNISSKENKTLYNYVKSFDEDMNNFNSSYPIILNMSSKKVADAFYFKCNGFNCNKYLDYIK